MMGIPAQKGAGAYTVNSYLRGDCEYGHSFWCMYCCSWGNIGSWLSSLALIFSVKEHNRDSVSCQPHFPALHVAHYLTWVYDSTKNARFHDSEERALRSSYGPRRAGQFVEIQTCPALVRCA